MRKRLTLDIEIGDVNYVKPGEYFAELSADGTTITAIKKRLDDLSMQTVVSTPLSIENNKAATANETPFVVNPTSGKDAMKKATVTIPLEAKTDTVSIASLTAGDTLSYTPSSGNLGMTSVTLTIAD